MISYIYQLIKPKVISVKYTNINLNTGRVIVRPEYMSICHADQRYYFGMRDATVLRKKLPMALIHECMGRVVYSPDGKFKVGDKVVMIPNAPGKDICGEYENYRLDSVFSSSGADGFMREFVDLPAERLVSCDGIKPQVAAMSEFVTIPFHAVSRFERAAQTKIERIGIWGDGGLGYLLALVLKTRFPNAKICVIGMDETKLSMFSFVDETYLADKVPDGFKVDHAFECCGGGGSYYAIKQVIDTINPQGTLMLMGVTEEEVPINTRMVLERGLTLVGCSRSGRTDFENTMEFLRDTKIQNRIERIISETVEINSIDDIYKSFDKDMTNPFKTILKWNI